MAAADLATGLVMDVVGHALEGGIVVERGGRRRQTEIKGVKELTGRRGGACMSFPLR